MALTNGCIDLKNSVDSTHIDRCIVDHCMLPGVEKIVHYSCSHCCRNFSATDIVVSFKDLLYHNTCFSCSQCFRNVSAEDFYEFDGRAYCEYDFQRLFAPICGRCGICVMDRVIKSMNRNWHPECFTCDICSIGLDTSRPIKVQDSVVCETCYSRMQPLPSTRLCKTCHQVVPENQALHILGELHHPYHFHCTKCNRELSVDGREKNGEAFCLRCFKNSEMAICAACRRPIDGRIVWALAQTWHADHFVCHHCGQPFLGRRYYEWKGHAYCYNHYIDRIGHPCYVCNRIADGDVVVEFTNKVYCVEHFTCSMCSKPLTKNDKLYEVDLKPVCKQCYGKLPISWRRKLAKLHKEERRA